MTGSFNVSAGKTGWVPAKVEQILQTDEQTICIRLRTIKDSGWLHVSWHPTSFHLSMGPAPTRGAVSEAFAFGEQLANGLRGLVLLQADLPQPWERVIALSLSSRPSDPISHVLYFEAMGRYSNVLLVDQESGKIKAAGRQIGGSQSRLRQLQVGGVYHLPPPAPGLDPAQARSLEEWVELVTRTAEQLGERKGRPASWQDALVRAFQGVSPGLVRDLGARAGVEGASPPLKLDQAAWQRLHAAWTTWIQAVQTGSPPSWTQPLARSLFWGPCRFWSQPPTQDPCRQAEATQRQADLLMANAFRYEEQGVREMELEDWDTGCNVAIVLEEGKSAVETAEGWYTRARKQRRAGKSLEPLIEATSGDSAYLREVQASLEQLAGNEDAVVNQDLAALQGIQDELVAGKFMKAPADAALAAKGAAKGRKAQKRSGTSSTLDRFRRFTSPSGLTVLVGRNNIQNDELSHRVAKDGDVWMHVRGFPGAHTLLQVPSGQEAGAEDVQCAADLAAYFSKARGEKRAPVIVASPADLKRPKGSRPGQVMVAKETVEYGRPDDSLAAAS
ncbi:hypothetical protein WJX84_009935 [Apatococcus fuscideae]|uniref:NFACT RNA-binding domain-containing protein n=1 Tax=Apatococcus fuscideae TaxID=2026836 RepID=A0AAW1TH91_9CHLO